MSQQDHRRHSSATSSNGSPVSLSSSSPPSWDSASAVKTDDPIKAKGFGRSIAPRGPRTSMHGPLPTPPRPDSSPHYRDSATSTTLGIENGKALGLGLEAPPGIFGYTSAVRSSNDSLPSLGSPNTPSYLMLNDSPEIKDGYLTKPSSPSSPFSTHRPLPQPPDPSERGRLPHASRRGSLPPSPLTGPVTIGIPLSSPSSTESTSSQRTEVAPLDASIVTIRPGSSTQPLCAPGDSVSTLRQNDSFSSGSLSPMTGHARLEPTSYPSRSSSVNVTPPTIPMRPPSPAFRYSPITSKPLATASNTPGPAVTIKLRPSLEFGPDQTLVPPFHESRPGYVEPELPRVSLTPRSSDSSSITVRAETPPLVAQTLLFRQVTSIHQGAPMAPMVPGHGLSPASSVASTKPPSLDTPTLPIRRLSITSGISGQTNTSGSGYSALNLDLSVPSPPQRLSTPGPPRAFVAFPSSISPVPEHQHLETVLAAQEHEWQRHPHPHDGVIMSTDIGHTPPPQHHQEGIQLVPQRFPASPPHKPSHLRTQSETVPIERKPSTKWTLEEIRDLAPAFKKHGVDKWEVMARDPEFKFLGRTPSDLEERFRKSYPDTYKEYHPHVKTSIFDRMKINFPSLKKLVPTRKKSLSPDVKARQNNLPKAGQKKQLQTANERVLNLTSNALETEDFSKVLNLSNDDALLALNLIQKMLESRSSDSVNGETEVAIRHPRSQLRRLILELSEKCQQVPKALFLTSVYCSETESRATGGFADIYRGRWEERGVTRDVALKCLRIFALSPESQKARLRQAFYRESLLWRNLQNKHVLPFFGVTGDVFPHSLCMVLPWMEHGNIRQYMHQLRESGELVNQVFVDSVNKWLYEIGLGLAYLHSEEVVHGDLRGANILIDKDGCVRLADFGLAITAQVTGHDYGKVFTHGGATRWQAPELLDPERFGSWSDLPTYSSDVYAFGSVCIELYTCQSPFSGLSDPQVYSMVLSGQRPARPTAREGEEMPDELWRLATLCWSEIPTDRPTAQQALEAILLATGGALSPHVGEPESPIPPQIGPSASPGELLTYLRVKGVEVRSLLPHTGGQSADIYVGRYRGRKVALRRLRISLRTEAEQKLYEMLYASALKWKQLQHKHVLAFVGIDVDVFKQGRSMVFPWMQFGNVRGFIKKLTSTNLFGNGHSWISRWIVQISRGLAYLHSEQVVHGALRGTNILIDEEWGVRLADYDQASILMQLSENTSSRASSTHRVLRWMPPEICEGASLTTTTDVYGFACVCVELYTCQDPFNEVTTDSRFIRLLADGSLNPTRPLQSTGAIADMPDSLWELLEKCWWRVPADRPTAADIVQTLTN